MTYPTVLSESDTLDQVIAGRSLARYGDGEFALAEGRSIVTQPRSPALCARMRGILQNAGACLVGIPNILSETPKAAFWEKYKRCAVLLNPEQAYASSFITRPDSAPWLDVPEYWDKLESLWRGRDVTLIRGTDPVPQRKDPTKLTGGISLVAADLTSARSVTEIIGPSVDAWAVYPSLLEQVDPTKIALICLGVAATVMAVDLCARGVHAVDLGHVGQFLHRHRKGEPMAMKRPRGVAA